MGLIYTIPRTSFALVAGNDVITVSGNALRSWRLLDIYLGGLGTASAANEIGICRTATVGITPGGALTPTPKNVRAPAFGGVVSTTWATQPVIGVVMDRLMVNANGGNIYRDFKREGLQLEWEAGGAAVLNSCMSIRCVSGSSSIVFGYTIEEI